MLRLQGWKVRWLMGSWATLALSMKAYSGSKPGDHNLREACRQQVAGKYLSLYDQREKNQALISHLQQKLSQLEKALIEAKAHLAQQEREVAKASFDLEKNAQLTGLAERYKLIKETLASEKEMMTKAKHDFEQAGVQLAQFKSKMLSLFTIKKLEGSGLGYKFKIEYQKPCPPFRFSCPLSQAEVNKLCAIYEEASIPEVCEKYANFMQW